ncbi:hypothetical protein CSKR_111886 [Clonorchis sinensis]|uniref:Uncharacterized protein n=1 Tax=Clonorchis sinensis TaxID=79923 RepID=A0A3R7D2B6_CLOSI|nr:hypothetical protein CSKR_111886 [Clonorchis sinensis]
MLGCYKYSARDIRIEKSSNPPFRPLLRKHMTRACCLSNPSYKVPEAEHQQKAAALNRFCNTPKSLKPLIGPKTFFNSSATTANGYADGLLTDRSPPQSGAAVETIVQHCLRTGLRHSGMTSILLAGCSTPFYRSSDWPYRWATRAKTSCSCARCYRSVTKKRLTIRMFTYVSGTCGKICTGNMVTGRSVYVLWHEQEFRRPSSWWGAGEKDCLQSSASSKYNVVKKQHELCNGDARAISVDDCLSQLCITSPWTIQCQQVTLASTPSLSGLLSVSALSSKQVNKLLLLSHWTRLELTCTVFQKQESRMQERWLS